MTREHKLALILGFALVLVVGVLISDHLSGARQATLESILDDPVAEAPLLAPGKPIPTTTEAERPAGEVYASNRTRGEDPLLSAPVERLALDDASDAGAMPPASLITGRPVDEELTLADSTERSGGTLSPEELRRYAKEQFGIDLTPVQPRVLGNMADTPRREDPTETGLRMMQPTAPAYPAPKSHTVKKDETLWSIARRHYGDGALHERLAAYNRSRLPDPSALRVGLTLLIPVKDELTRSSDATLAERGARAEASAPAASKPAAPAQREHREYVVQKGDTLGEISMETLGTSKRWREIYELNTDRIDDPDNVLAGTRLRIPPK